MKKIYYFMHLYSFFFFLLKNTLLIFYAFYLAKYLKSIRAYLSKTFFSHYFKTSDLNKNGLIPSVMVRNVSNSVQGFYAYFEHLNDCRDITAVITISVIILFIIL